MKSFLSQKNLPCLLLVVYLIKCLFFPIATPDAIIGIILTILFGLKLFLDYNEKPDLVTSTLNRLNKLEEENAELIKLKTKMQDLDGKVAVLSMGALKSQENKPLKFGW